MSGNKNILIGETPSTLSGRWAWGWGICCKVVARWTAGQQVKQSILHKGHDS